MNKWTKWDSYVIVAVKFVTDSGLRIGDEVRICLKDGVLQLRISATTRKRRRVLGIPNMRTVCKRYKGKRPQHCQRPSWAMRGERGPQEVAGHVMHQRGGEEAPTAHLGRPGPSGGARLPFNGSLCPDHIGYGSVTCKKLQVPRA